MDKNNMHSSLTLRHTIVQALWPVLPACDARSFT
jgi:hypothetical protein